MNNILGHKKSQHVYTFICPLKIMWKYVHIHSKVTTIYFRKIGPEMRPIEIPHHAERCFSTVYCY